jgi:hypothetical protein
MPSVSITPAPVSERALVAASAKASSPGPSGAELAEEGDRLGPRRAEIVERPSGTERAGEPNRLDERMPDQSAPQFMAGALDQRKYPGRHATARNRHHDGFGHDLAGRGMCRMALDHDRTARGERRSGIASGGREGEREIRGTKDRDRPDRPLNHLQIGSRQWRAVGQGRVVAAVEVIAVADMIREEPQLAGGASALALKTRLGQAGFRTAKPGDVLAPRVNLFGDGIKEGRAVIAGGPAKGGKGLFRRLRGTVHFCNAARRKAQRVPRHGLRCETGF